MTALTLPFQPTSAPRSATPPSPERGYIVTPAQQTASDARTMLEAAQSRLFELLAQIWQEDTYYTSSVREMVEHPAYQQIIALGPPAVPFLLRALRDRPDHWFWALHAITGEDPAQGETTVPGATLAWLRWGTAHGYLD